MEGAVLRWWWDVPLPAKDLLVRRQECPYRQYLVRIGDHFVECLNCFHHYHCKVVIAITQVSRKTELPPPLMKIFLLFIVHIAGTLI